MSELRTLFAAFLVAMGVTEVLCGLFPLGDALVAAPHRTAAEGLRRPTSRSRRNFEVGQPEQ